MYTFNFHILNAKFSLPTLIVVRATMRTHHQVVQTCRVMSMLKMLDSDLIVLLRNLKRICGPSRRSFVDTMSRWSISWAASLLVLSS